MRMLQTLLGEVDFVKGVGLYLTRHDGQAATVEDFLAAMDAVTVVDLQQFRLWYEQAGTPRVTVTSRYSPAEQAFELTFEQQCPETPGQATKNPLVIPCRIGLLDATGKPMKLVLADRRNEGDQQELVLDLRDARQTFRFVELAESPVASLFRQFSAPVRVFGDESSRQRAFLLAHDADPFNRWDAGQRLAEDIILQGVSSPTGVLPATELRMLTEGFDAILQDTCLDPGLAAKLLELPGELYLAQQVDEVDVEAIHQSRQQVRQHLASLLEDTFHGVCNASQDSDSYSVAPQAVARRSLKNRCLDYLGALGTENSRALLCDSYRSANNMTDRIAALALLVEESDPVRQPMLRDFYQRAARDPLVLDKWFAVQARSRRKDTLQVVRELLNHPAYQPRNPNRVRALIGSFSRANPLCFHAADGSGYELLGEQILRLDPVNPQLAGFLAGGFSAWRRFDTGRQNRMQQQLRIIAARPKLSRDLKEVVGKLLV